MKPDDIEHIWHTGRPTVAPDSDRIVFAAAHPDIRANRTVGQLWTVPASGESPARRLTRGTLDTHPQFSPDGRWIAFLRTDGDGVAQLAVMPSTGGEPQVFTKRLRGVLEFAWLPDGRRIVFLSREPEPGRHGSVEGLDASHESPRRIRGVAWTANGVGHTFDQPVQLFVVDVPDPLAEPDYSAAPTPDGAHEGAVAVAPGEPRVLSDSPQMSYDGLAVAPDGHTVVSIERAAEPATVDLRDRVVAFETDPDASSEQAGAKARVLLPIDAGLRVKTIAFSPSGRLYAVGFSSGADHRTVVVPETAVFEIDAGRARPLTVAGEHDFGDPDAHLSFADDVVLVQERSRGRLTLVAIDNTGAVSTILGGDVEVHSHAAIAGGIAVSVATPVSPSEIGIVDVAGLRTLTDFGSHLRSTGLSTPIEHVFDTRDGHGVHGWVSIPRGDGPHPVILNIHGGPYSNFGIHPFDETQVMTSAGFAVVYCNPRGSAGYGVADGASIKGRMGTIDFTDVIDFLDGALAAHPQLDATRLGIMGGSYGGYLSAWTIAHDHRFRGAIVERGFLDPISFQGTSDIGSYFGDELVGTEPTDIARQSPMAVVNAVTTPTLVIHSENDLRCPLEQGLRYYSSLKRNGVDTELLIFPGETHELTRSGQPRHRIERFAAVLGWWQRYLAA